MASDAPCVQYRGKGLALFGAVACFFLTALI